MTEPSVTERVLPTSLDGGRLRAARAGWLVLAVGIALLATAGFARAFRDPDLVAIPTLVEVFVSLGLPLRAMMVIGLVAPLAAVIVMSAVIYARRSHDPMALLFTVSLLLLFAYSSRSLLAFEGDPLLHHAVSVVFAGGTICLALLFALFPDGRAAPRASRWLIPAMVLFVVAFPDGGWVLQTLLDGSIEVSARVRALVVSWFALALLGFLAQAYRYRHVSGPTERQQIKWVMAPLGLLFTAIAVPLALPAVLPHDVDRVAGWVILAVIPLGTLFPVMVANAVLRYRLYEIDRIISRTVSYGLVVAVLVAVYVAGVVGLGTVVSSLTGREGSDLAVAASVLAVVALFGPVRARAQRAVDRRFNRTGYEARVAVAAFAQALRDEVNLDAIERDLANTAAAAVQPARVAVWLVPVDDEG